MRKLEKIHLHSTMLLLYPGSNHRISWMHLHLHSTMLLLYLNGFTGITPAFLIYIPLCFYFISGCALSSRPYAPFTFHYASTLSKWLYRNHARLLDLHSTMLLLYLRLRAFISSLCSIYIPLCFYFIFCIADMILSHILIYIPLCFYFIYVYSDYAVLLLLIYIPLCFYFILSAPSRKQSRSLNLHSTMLLLYPYTPGVYANLNWIYIPLCFYFIGECPELYLWCFHIYIPLCFYFIRDAR